MTTLQNWHDIVMSVQNANLDKQKLQKNIKSQNKRFYREELDREVEQKNRTHFMQNLLKMKELQQAKMMAQGQKQAKMREKLLKSKTQKQYGQGNLSLVDINKMVKHTSQQIQRKQTKNFLEHPFIKLVDEQDKRNQQLRRKLIKQNQINHIQEKIKLHTEHTIRNEQMQERSDFINYVQRGHQKRSQQRQKFKNKYLRIKKSQIPSGYNNTQFCQDISAQRMYINYLNNQMKNDSQKKKVQKSQLIDDERLTKFYSKNVEPDSSPAYLGRNPLTYQRRRQLYYINKHLNTIHERSATTNISAPQKGQNKHALSKQYRNIGQYSRLDHQLNPQMGQQIRKHHLHPLNAQSYKNHSESVKIKPNIGSQQSQLKSQTNTHRKYDLGGQKNSIIFKNSFGDRQRQNIFDPYSNYRQEHNLAQDSRRRIKSQLTQNKSKYSSMGAKYQSISVNPVYEQNNQERMPALSNNMSTYKKEYVRYDFITGKQVVYHA